MEEQVPRRRSQVRLRPQTGADKVALDGHLEPLDGALDLLLRHQVARVAVRALNLERRHFERAHAERVDVDGRRHPGYCNQSHREQS